MKDNDNECDDGATAVVEWPGGSRLGLVLWMMCRCQRRVMWMDAEY